jgi:hypothetical protein
VRLLHYKYIYILLVWVYALAGTVLAAKASRPPEPAIRVVDVAKKVNGRKGHALVDTDGRGLLLQVSSADVKDRGGTAPLRRAARLPATSSARSTKVRFSLLIARKQPDRYREYAQHGRCPLIAIAARNRTVANPPIVATRSGMRCRPSFETKC